MPFTLHHVATGAAVHPEASIQDVKHVVAGATQKDDITGANIEGELTAGAELKLIGSGLSVDCYLIRVRTCHGGEVV